jgi:hypothetical protein
MFLRRNYLGRRPSAVREYLELQRLLAEEEEHLAKVVQLADKGKAPLADLESALQEWKASRAAVEACLEKALEDLRKR